MWHSPNQGSFNKFKTELYSCVKEQADGDAQIGEDAFCVEKLNVPKLDIPTLTREDYSAFTLTVTQKPTTDITNTFRSRGDRLLHPRDLGLAPVIGQVENG